MGAACSAENSVYTEKYVHPLSSVHSSGSRGIRGKLSNILSSSSSTADSNDSFEYDSHTDKSKSPHNANQSPDDNTNWVEAENLPTTPAPIPRPNPDVPKVAWNIEIPVSVKRLLCGRLSERSPARPEDKVVRIFHCANFSDSQIERNLLHERVYPALREYCAEHSCELEVLDFHYGLSDEFVFGHLLRSLNLEALVEVTEIDKNTILSVFLNEKYGNYWCPFKIEVDSVQCILKKVTEDDKHFFLSWYKLDDNSVPPLYVLQPVEAQITKYGDSNRDIYKEGYREWEKQLIRLRNILCQATGAELQKVYFISYDKVHCVIPGVEKQLEASLFSGKTRPDNTLWLRRTLRSWNPENSSPFLGHYLDLNRDRLDESAQIKLKTLSHRLSDRLEPKHILNVEVAWDADKGIDPSAPYYKKYLDRVSEKYEAALRDIVQHVVQLKGEHDQSRTKMTHKGLPSTLYSDVLHNTCHCQRLVKSIQPRPQLTQQLESYVITGVPSTEPEDDEENERPFSPLLLHGREGSGKSTAAAVLAGQVCTVEGWTGCACVMRFVGCSRNGTETLADLLLSIGEQICVLAQLQITTVYNMPVKDILHNLLPQITTNTPCVIILDGLERLETADNIEMEWLPLSLPQHIRIILTVLSDTKCHRSIKNRLRRPDMTVNIPHLSSEERSAMLDNFLSGSKRTLAESQLCGIYEEMAEETTPLCLAIVAQRVKSWDSATRIPANEFSNLKAMQLSIIQDLEKCFGHKLIEKALLYLLCSRNGVNNSEMNDLLSCHSNNMDSCFKFGQTSLQKIPPLIWYVIKKKLRLFLIERTEKGIPLTHIHNMSLKDLLQERYKNEFHQSTKELLAYFDGQLPKKLVPSGKTSIRKPSKTSRQCLLKTQPLKWKESANHRKLREKPYLLSKLGRAKELSACIFDWDWLSSMFKTTCLKDFLRDVALYESLKSNLGVADVAFLKEFISKTMSVFLFDPRQFGLHLYMAVETGQVTISDDLCFCKALYKNIVSHLPAQLIPTKPEMLQTITVAGVNINRLVRLKNDDNHVVSIATESGEIKVWNIHTREPVRTLTGMDEPKDLKMCDMMKAVVLCNRELIAYDLDEGCKIIKLKGVLNIRMPYFGVHDKDHTIAMARNRMYVNVMSNVTGEMVTTFKVGEDRFLNSLLVSDMGNVCVCGDAVQKPFPLLVWDLHSRKLIYDLRIHGHEFLTKMAAITTEGSYVVCVAREIDDPDPNAILVYDLQSGSVFKKWKRDFSSTAVAISSKTSQVVSGHEDGSVVVWDLISGNVKYELRGHCRGPDVMRLSETGNHCITYDSTGRDSTLWHWSLSEGKALGCFCAPSGISCAEISADGEMVIIGLPGNGEIVTLLPPGVSPKAGDTGVFGDASRKGNVYDVSKDPLETNSSLP